MKKSIIIGFITLILAGCDSSSSVKETKPNDTPTSPTTQEKGNTPPSVPNI